jgi:hypothetical protein
MPQSVDTAAPALNLQRRPVYGPVDPATVAPAPARSWEQDRFRLSPEAQAKPWKTAEDAQRERLTQLVSGNEFASARPSAMGPHGNLARRQVNPLSGVKVINEDLGDGWRLQAAASPRRGGTVGVGVRRTF